MKTIEYKVTLGDGRDFTVAVQAREISTGFVSAVKLARWSMALPDSGMAEAELHSIEFWQVRD